MIVLYWTAGRELGTHELYVLRVCFASSTKSISPLRVGFAITNVDSPSKSAFAICVFTLVIHLMLITPPTHLSIYLSIHPLDASYPGFHAPD